MLSCRKVFLRSLSESGAQDVSPGASAIQYHNKDCEARLLCGIIPQNSGKVYGFSAEKRIFSKKKENKKKPEGSEKRKQKILVNAEVNAEENFLVGCSEIFAKFGLELA